MDFKGRTGFHGNRLWYCHRWTVSERCWITKDIPFIKGIRGESCLTREKMELSDMEDSLNRAEVRNESSRHSRLINIQI